MRRARSGVGVGPDDNGRRPSLGRRQGQPAAGGEGENPGLSPSAHQDGAGRAASQSVLASGKQGRGVRNPNQDEIIHIKAPLVQAAAAERADLMASAIVVKPDQRPGAPHGQAKSETLRRDPLPGRPGIDLMQAPQAFVTERIKRIRTLWRQGSEASGQVSAKGIGEHFVHVMFSYNLPSGRESQAWKESRPWIGRPETQKRPGEPGRWNCR